MKVRKQDIQLSPEHPSPLLELKKQLIVTAPLVINADGILVDGYRRYQLHEGEFIEVVQIDLNDVFDTAYQMNLHTRKWDDVDCFLWTRWAREIGANAIRLPIQRYSYAIESASKEILRLMADRKITMRKAILIQESPVPARDFFVDLLTNVVSVNDNEAADLIRMSWDTKTKLKAGSVSTLFQTEPFAGILRNSGLSARQKGEALLKELRSVRYPLYQEKLEHFTSNWHQLNLGRGVLAKGSSFIERGVLEISFTSSSLEELKENIRRLATSLDSESWARIWKE
jgi:hypothetical protein